MFETLTGRLNEVFDKLKRRGKLSADDVDVAMREVRLALLEADVHYSVVKSFVAKLKEEIIGSEINRALKPGQQVVKIVNEELIAMLGDPAPLELKGDKPRVLMLVGLQGAGKTTAAGKLAKKLRERGERVMLAAGDPYRPAAAQQLQALGERIDVPVFWEEGLKPEKLAEKALKQAKKGGYTLLIIDTAGRSQLDGEMMDELRAVAKKTNPVETLLVVDSMIGQEALPIAEGFRDATQLTGLILSKMDGDARGGAAISIRSVTGVPIKFLGTGEKLDALESYDPARLTSRILGMGDMIGLIEKAEALFDTEDAEKQAQDLMEGSFTLQSWMDQMKQVRKMGPLGQIMDMLPGQMGQAARDIPPEEMEAQMKRTEAILSSMTVLERENPKILNASRRRRIAAGSGNTVQDVNKLMKQFRETSKMFKLLQKSGGRGLSRLFG
ncbi:MAG: signal recognition particle protein [Anaerolineae bacterium]|nr:signal recognition particle protein [Anaerolineae bacterium]MBT7075269.1 signal recognition particle protein [Anaerolineae bacterium]MBT7783213.1 signal recognition particle protein [Anaerolineae bacterium]